MAKKKSIKSSGFCENMENVSSINLHSKPLWDLCLVFKETNGFLVHFTIVFIFMRSQSIQPSFDRFKTRLIAGLSQNGILSIWRNRIECFLQKMLTYTKLDSKFLRQLAVIDRKQDADGHWVNLSTIIVIPLLIRLHEMRH